MKLIETITGKPIYFLVVVSQLLVFLAINFSPIKPKPYGDPDFYPEGKQLSLMLKGVEFDEPLVIDKAPLPSVMYAIPFLFVSGVESNYQWAAVVFNMLIATLGAYFFVQGVRLLIGRKGALLSLFFLTVFPMHIYYSFGINAEVFAFSAVAFALFYFVKYSQSKANKHLFLAFLFIMLLLFARPNALLFLPIMAAITVVLWFKAKQPEFLKTALTSIILFIVFQVSITIIANIQRENTGGKAQDNYLLYVVNQGFYQFRDEPLDWRYWQNTHRKGSVDYANWNASMPTLNDIQKSRELSMGYIVDKYFWQDFKERPWKKMRQSIMKAAYGQVFMINSKPVKFFAKVSKTGLPEYIILHIIINLVNIILLLLSVLYIIKMPKDNLLNWFLLSIWLGILIFPSVVYMEPRYLFPSRLVLVLFSTLYLIDYTRFFKAKSLKASQFE